MVTRLRGSIGSRSTGVNEGDPWPTLVVTVVPQAQIGTADETVQQWLQDAQGRIGMRILNSGQ